MSEPATFSFKKKGKGRPANVRKRSLSPSTDTPAAAASASSAAAEPEASAVVQSIRKQAANHLIQGTGGAKRRRAAEEADADLLSSEDETDAALRQAQSFIVNHSSTHVRPRRRSSSPPAELAGATSAPKRDEREDDAVDDGLYRGQAKQAHNITGKSFGPVKGGPSNVRTITLVDYQPDVCKDYKETGFCGFGDTCKFLHDRGDYLHGWQLDNSFLSSQAAAGSFMAKQNARNNQGPAESDSDSDDEDLPFACLICRKPFGKDPVVTLCGHYFHSQCAVNRYKKTGKCFACGKGTNGVFNKATKLIAKQKEREELQKAAEAEQREFEDDDDDGIDIEGLAEDGPGAGADEEEESEEEEEERPKKRRPIIEIH